MSKSWHNSPLLTVSICLLVVLAGCSESPDPPPTEPPESPAATTTTTAGTHPAAVSNVTVERLNTTLTFPRATQGNVASQRFEIPEAAVAITLRHQLHLECPAGYAADPSLELSPPSGPPLVVRTMPEVEEGQTTVYPCPLGGLAPRPWHEVTLDAQRGGWEIRTLNECTCQVAVVVESHDAS